MRSPESKIKNSGPLFYFFSYLFRSSIAMLIQLGQCGRCTRIPSLRVTQIPASSVPRCNLTGFLPDDPALMRIHAPFAESPRRSKSAAMPIPPSTSGPARFSAAAENGLATTSVAKLKSPEILADMPRSCHWNGISKASRVAATSACRNRSSAHSIAASLAGEPVTRPPISSVRDCRSPMMGVSPSIAATSRSVSSSAFASHENASASTASEYYMKLSAFILWLFQWRVVRN